MFWKVDKKAWLQSGWDCWIILGGKPVKGVIAQANGDISCVEVEGGRQHFRSNPNILVQIDGVYMVGHG